MTTSSRVDHAVRVLPLSDHLLNTYLSWCPIADRPLIAPGSTAQPVRGHLELKVQRLAGLGPLRDLVGRKGWLRMEALWIEEEPQERFLLCAVILEILNRPGPRVVPLHLWHAWQPAYRPTFHKDTTVQGFPPSNMHTSLEDAIKLHLEASIAPWIQRHLDSARTILLKAIEESTASVDALDAQRRELRHASHSSAAARVAIRDKIGEAERELSNASEMLAGLEPKMPRMSRQVLCELAWTLNGPCVSE